MMISVIVPVYNVEDYIEDCLLSIQRQTYHNIEVILVDDGSSDRSGAICDSWAKKDPRFRVIHKTNGGLSDARNTGLGEAAGDLVAFVDSDDVIHPDMLRILYEGMTRTGCGICCCGMQEGVLSEDTQSSQEMKELKVYTADHAFLEMIQGSDVYVSVCNKLYTREAAGGIPFRKGKCHEDEFWSWRVIDRAERVAAVGNPLYGYRQREESIMNSRYSIRRLDLLDAREDRQRLFEQKYPGLVRKGKCDLRFECIRAWQFSLLYLSGEDRKKSRKKIRNMIRRHPVSLADCAGLPVGRKFWYLLSGISFEGTCRIRNRFHFGP